MIIGNLLPVGYGEFMSPAHIIHLPSAGLSRFIHGRFIHGWIMVDTSGGNPESNLRIFNFMAKSGDDEDEQQGPGGDGRSCVSDCTL